MAEGAHDARPGVRPDEDRNRDDNDWTDPSPGMHLTVNRFWSSAQSTVAKTFQPHFQDHRILDPDAAPGTSSSLPLGR